ncbi:MAG: hypothetical protein K9L30_04905 [Desulfobacterales bacterium]|nr:hypothetical protein [Desulfobacterales bacterium]
MSIETYSPEQINIVTDSTKLAEELVSNYFKLSTSQWLRQKYDVKTLAELQPEEIVYGPFAQIVRYEGRKSDTALGSSNYDFYKICFQDHAVLSVLNKMADIQLFPFSLYIITHELVHIVRFSKFLQNFDASPDEKLAEEKRVHDITHKILKKVKVDGIDDVFRFYIKWRDPIEEIHDF